MEKLLEKYKEYKQDLKNYDYAGFIIGYDAVTDCPKLDRECAFQVADYFSKKVTNILLSDDYKNTIYSLYENRSKLDEVTKLDIEIEYKDMKKTEAIPKDELFKHIDNLSRCYLTWEEARTTLDYSAFEKELEELVSFNKKLISYWETSSLKGYDVLLDDCEEGYNEKMYDEFFDKIEQELVPYIKDILNKKAKYNPKLDSLKFDIDTQKKLTKIIAETMEYDSDVGCIRETIHPFTSWANHNDVRITTRYEESLLFSNLYSIMHEIGHALFQIQMDPKYDDTKVFNNVSCITHESQSRFYENYLGRSRAFVKYIYPILCKLYPEEFIDITEDDIYYYVNAVKAQFYRVEADELTYPIHVLIRYKIEKMLFHNEIEVKDISTIWNKYMYEYLGITPSNKKEGCYQDSHWTSSFGYFPTYALGSAYGAMFLEELKKDIDIDKELACGNFKNINAWLKEHIHCYSGTRKNLEVIKAVCNKDFNPDIYIKYLKDKFDEIY